MPDAADPPFCEWLQFEPLFRRYLWGGRKLGTLLGRPIGHGDDYAESWELVDHGADQSVVAAGPLAGMTLAELVRDCGPELLGRHAGRFSQFPLLLKLLDCQRTLSVQVHPNDEQAAQLDPPDLGKTEAWVVLASEPGSKIYAGLKRGTTRDSLAAAVAAGRCEECLHAFEPRVGDCVFIPAGTVHALGAGLVIAEIQQASDTTFRLFDWNRVGADGQPRPLHIEQSLAVADYARGPVEPQAPQPTGEPGRERLVACDKFVVDRVTWEGTRPLGGDDRCRIVVAVAGDATVKSSRGSATLSPGGTGMVPAAGRVEAIALLSATILEITLPD